MIDSAAYRANETNAKRAIADWRLSNVNDPYVFQNQGFPVRADSFLDLAQILDTMQEGRFDYYMKELAGFTEEDTNFFVSVCLDYIDFYTSFFQRERVVVPLSTLIAHFVAYKKLLGYDPRFTRVLELGPGCGYLSFFLRHHPPLEDYTQIESTESFYLLQSHINSHVFGSRFAEHALSRLALEDHGKYVPKLNWHNPFHYEDQKIINVKTEPVCNHFPWWRIGEVSKRRYDIVASNANLNEFSREALFQYLSLIREVLTDDGAIVAQCLGGGPPSYDTIFANMKSAGFVPVALIQGGANMDGRTFVVSNGVFVGEKHPLYEKYVNVRPQFPMLDRKMGFVDKMYFLNEEQLDRKHVLSISNVLHAILDQIEAPAQRSGHASRKRALELDVRAAELESDTEDSSSKQKAPVRIMDGILSSAHLRDVNRLRRVARLEGLRPDVANAPAPLSDSDEAGRSERNRLWIEGQLAREVEMLKREIEALQSSRSWRVTAPLRSLGRWVRWMRQLRA
jgi:hypothetical protein